MPAIKLPKKGDTDDRGNSDDLLYRRGASCDAGTGFHDDAELVKGDTDAARHPAASIRPAHVLDARAGEGGGTRAAAPRMTHVSAAADVPADASPVRVSLHGEVLPSPLFPLPSAPPPPVEGKKRASTKPKKDEPPLLCEPAKVREAIATFRGCPLEGQNMNIRNNTEIKAWCQAHTEEELAYVMEALAKDKYWGKHHPEKHYRHFWGKNLAEKTPEVLDDRRRKQAAPVRRSTIEVPPDFGMDEPLSLVAAAVKRPTPRYVFD